MRVRTPASSANLGPGFDTLAVALARYVTVEVEPASELQLYSSGFGSDLQASEDHLAVRVARAVLGHTMVKITIDSDIPVARGMGSSAALAVAVAQACGSDDPLGVAVSFEGHPENAAASLYGGAIAAVQLPDGAVVREIPLDPDLVAILVIPAVELSTHQARTALPQYVPYSDAVRNIARALSLALSLGSAASLRSSMFEDALHQPYRASIFPQARGILEMLRDCGCIGSAWSGAGSTMIGFSRRSDSVEIIDQLGKRLAALDGEYEASMVEFDRIGSVVDLMP